MSHTRHRLISVCLATLAATSLAACRPAFWSVLGPLPPVDPAVRPRTDEFLKHVRVLADPASGGRMTCTPGHALARDYIVKQFASAGLKPGGRDGSWFQHFPTSSPRMPGKAGYLRLTDGTEFMLHEDFSPMAAGSSGRCNMFEGPLVFAGYGCRNKPLGYDDYAGVDVRGKVVMIMRGTHRGTGPKSTWWKKGPDFREELFWLKGISAAEAGAVAMLVVTPPGIAEQHDPLSSVILTRFGALPAVRISRTLADRLLKRAGNGKMLAALAGEIRRTGKPVSFSVPVYIVGRAELAFENGQNVVGLVPATSGKKTPVIVVGAHYDHLPASGEEARDPGIGVRPGADDNASGVSALILVAKGAAAMKRRNCTFVFIAFDGEEFGFYGSNYYVAYPVFPLKRTEVMINLDQIGRMKGGGVLIVGNVFHKPLWEAIAAAVALNRDVKPTLIPFVQKSGWSDQAAFARNGVPTLFFYAGSRRDNHRMTDTADRINAAGGAGIASLVFDTLRALDLWFKPTPPPKDDRAVRPVASQPSASGTGQWRRP